MSVDPFADLPKGHFKAIYADPPWRWESWGKYRGQRAGFLWGNQTDKFAPPATEAA